MSLPQKELENRTSADDKEFLYAVLNLPTSASQSEIRERHRALSVVFHPDKQQDERTKETAAKRFLEIQKAYEVLSDPFSREVYDAFGEEGLSIKWEPELRSLPQESVRIVLRQRQRDWIREKLEKSIRPRGRLSCGLDVSSLFDPYLGSANDRWHERLLHRFEDVYLSKYSLSHNIQKDLGENTRVSLGSRLVRGKRNARADLFGTIRHQFSPRWTFEGTGAFLQPHILNLKTTYRDNENALQIQGHISPHTLLNFPPPVTVSLSRKLFPQSLMEGTVTFRAAPIPSVAVNVISPQEFNLTSEHRVLDYTDPEFQTDPIPVSGFSIGSRYWSGGINLDPLNPNLNCGWGITFSALSLQLRTGLELGIQGLGWLCSGSWASETSEVAANMSLNGDGVTVRLDFSYLEQRLTVPITLSQEKNHEIAFWTVIVPSTMFILGYHFVLKPRRRKQRVAYIRAARRALEEDNSAVQREREETVSLLKETAKKHMQLERSRGGLVIIDAKYGSTETYEGAHDLIIDVTIAVQALVHNSQLYIPGHRSKSGIQGFFDPAPLDSKFLQVNYLFRGRQHYAEIPDYSPVVLPLADHLVQ